MAQVRRTTKPRASWVPIADSEAMFSSGIRELDQLLGGGFRRGSMALVHVDATTEPTDWERLVAPAALNFLAQSNGVIAVLPSRTSPSEFRSHLTRWTSRRRFDTRVRVIDYVGEAEERPYVVPIQVPNPARPKTRGSERLAERTRAREMARMVAAERAVRGARSRMFLELVAFEMAELVAGAELASRMFLFGIKRTRSVGNLCLGLLRPGLGCGDAVRGMADVELRLHRTGRGLCLAGLRPAFPDHLIASEPDRGDPYVTLVPAPSPAT